MSKIRMQCRRGMLELDFIFERFLETQYDALSATDQVLFSQLLEEEDVTLYDWLVVGLPCPNPALQSIVKKVRL